MSRPRPLLTRSEVRRLLDEYGLAPRKAAGQNFVVDANTVRKVVRDAGVAAGDVVCEIGPGLGSLTLALREAGAVVVAVEVDAGLVRALDEVIGGEPGVRLVHADALHVDLAALTRDLTGSGTGTGRVRLVANLPYNIATPLVFRALEAGVFEELFVMVQREVGQRWAARVGDPSYGAVSVKLAAHAHVQVVAQVSRQAFLPVPNVDSVTMRIAPRPWPHDVARSHVARLVDAGFSQRRKRLRNTLATLGHAPPAVEAALAAAGLEAGARAEELSLGEWVALAGQLIG